jgi:hypothetical protein
VIQWPFGQDLCAYNIETRCGHYRGNTDQENQMSKKESKQIPARARIAALSTVLASLLPAAETPPQGKTKGRRAATKGSLNAGDVFGVVLLMALPTTLNNAMMRAPKHGGDLGKALDESVTLNHDTGAANAYHALVADPRLKPLFDAMLVPANLDALSKIANTVMSSVGVLVGWGTPPHPEGGTVARVIAALKPITE